MEHFGVHAVKPNKQWNWTSCFVTQHCKHNKLNIFNIYANLQLLKPWPHGQKYTAEAKLTGVFCLGHMDVC